MEEPTFQPETPLLPYVGTLTNTPSRRILIADVPTNIHLYSVLRATHSGPLLSAFIHDTTPLLGTNTAVLEFFHHESATEFFESLQDGKLTLTAEEGAAITLRPCRAPSSSAPVPERIAIPVRGGASRVIVAAGFPRRCIYPFLVEADLHRGTGLQSVVEISYSEVEGSTGMGTLTIELSSVRVAYHVKRILRLRLGLLATRLPVATSHFFGRDPCEQGEALTTGILNLPQNVRDPIGFFTLPEFLSTPLSPTLPDPTTPTKSTGLTTMTLRPGDPPPSSAAHDAAREFSTERWTHRDPGTGAQRTRIPFGWSMTPQEVLEDFVFRNLETGDEERRVIVDSWFEARGLVNLRKMIALGAGRAVCAANLWGVLRG